MKQTFQKDGELFVQKMRGAPPEMPSILAQMISPTMPEQHSTFFAGLSYITIGALDLEGRPWVSLLCSPIVTTISPNKLKICAKVAQGDPFSLAASTSHCFAGVGVDFTNRRRNKLAGVIEEARLDLDLAESESESGSEGSFLCLLSLSLRTTESLGNCPKYITERSLAPLVRRPVASEPSPRTLSAAALGLLEQCSTVFLAARHSSGEGEGGLRGGYGMGVNHRGGAPGFVRYYEDSSGGGVGGHLVIPDYSGNQFYQSLGSVHSDGLVGLVAVDFLSGDSLHVTGRAKNIFDGAAEAIMPRATLITVLSIDIAVLIKGSMQFELIGVEKFSPYNPPIRLLSSEIRARGRIPPNEILVMAKLINIKRHCSSISTFSFLMPSPVIVSPGGYAIFDFSDIIPKQYEHMNRTFPKSVNDDHVRTWTVSNISKDKMEISITVKLVTGGLVSSFLHALTPMQTLQVMLRGFGGGISYFCAGGNIPTEMLWCVTGVGLTPFLSVYGYLQQNADLLAATKITLLYSCRGDERNLVQNLGTNPHLLVIVFDSSSPSIEESVFPITVNRRRLSLVDVRQACGISTDRTAFLCGSSSYNHDVQDFLRVCNWPADRIWEESFSF
jgi:ferredoxin-NADP reductase